MILAGQNELILPRIDTRVIGLGQQALDAGDKPLLQNAALCLRVAAGHQQIAVRAEWLVVPFERQKLRPVLLLPPVIECRKEASGVEGLPLRPGAWIGEPVEKGKPRDRDEPLSLVDHAGCRTIAPSVCRRESQGDPL